MSCGVDYRLSLDAMLLWLWCRRAAAALIRSLAWEFPYAALKKKKMKKSVMYTTLYFYLCVPYSILTIKNLVSICYHNVDPLYPLGPPIPSPPCAPSHLVNTILFSVSMCLLLFSLFTYFVLFLFNT